MEWCGAGRGVRGQFINTDELPSLASRARHCLDPSDSLDVQPWRSGPLPLKNCQEEARDGSGVPASDLSRALPSLITIPSAVVRRQGVAGRHRGRCPTPWRRHFSRALAAPGVAAVDRLAGSPWLPQVLFPLPAALTDVQPPVVSWVIGVDVHGTVRHHLRDTSGLYASITSVQEVDGVLWLGSLFGRAVGRAQAPAGP